MSKIIDVLSSVASLLSQTDDVNTSLARILVLLEDMGLNSGELYLADQDHGLDGKAIQSMNIPKAFKKSFQDCILTAISQREPMLLPLSPDFEPPSPHQDTHWVVVPLNWGDRLLGVLGFFTHHSKMTHSATALAPLQILATMIAQGLGLHQNQMGVDVVHKQTAEGQIKEQLRPIKTAIRGNSKAIHEVFELIAQVSPSDTSVLILGESGVGKELVADAIHDNSPRAKKPLTKINCAAIPESLLESELFGYEKGAFTGANQQKKGRFELADGGTLFLDEIGEISPATQVKLLRFLQEKEFERVGGNDTLSADVRIIAATNRSLEAMIDRGEFRLDLYYRLNVFPIYVPALRERKPDIIPITDYFIDRYNQKLDRHVQRISTPAIDLLVSYHWPGNVRELENCVERAILLSTDGVIHSHHLPPSLQMAQVQPQQSDTLKNTLESVEKELICDALRGSRGNMAKAARVLGLTERVMGLRIRKYAIDPKKYRSY